MLQGGGQAPLEAEEGTGRILQEPCLDLILDFRPWTWNNCSSWWQWRYVTAATGHWYPSEGWVPSGNLELFVLTEALVLLDWPLFDNSLLALGKLMRCVRKMESWLRSLRKAQANANHFWGSKELFFQTRCLKKCVCLCTHWLAAHLVFLAGLKPRRVSWERLVMWDCPTNDIWINSG